MYQSRQGKVWIWLVASLLLGMVVMVVVHNFFNKNTDQVSLKELLTTYPDVQFAVDLPSTKPEETSFPNSFASQAPTIKEGMTIIPEPQGIITNDKDAQNAPESLQNEVKKVEPKSFVVQVASYKDIGSAEQMVKELMASGEIAVFEPLNLKEKGLWYRIWVGEYESKQQAQNALQKYKNKFPGSFIVNRSSLGS